ncbi:perlucin-like protein [Mytilus trossulus]|uniref:perlucin-like protein n=1 Tax=Mytilus trossulus TaxID=6551 RepID=UPI003006674B
MTKLNQQLGGYFEEEECILGSSRCHDKTESATGWLFLRRGTSYNNKVFFYFGNKLDWYDAQNFCESFGMRLATISTTEENQFVKSLTQRSNGVWLGGSDKPNEGDWHWNKPNLPLAFTNWGWSALIKQPDNVFNQDCLSYWRCDPFETNYQWADAGCGSSYYFICERIIRVDTETWPIE